MGSPIDSWDGVEAYFTGAHSPLITGLILLVSVALVALAVVSAAKHEREAYSRNGGGN